MCRSSSTVQFLVPQGAWSSSLCPFGGYGNRSYVELSCGPWAGVSHSTSSSGLELSQLSPAPAFSQDLELGSFPGLSSAHPGSLLQLTSASTHLGSPSCVLHGSRGSPPLFQQVAPPDSPSAPLSPFLLPSLPQHPGFSASQGPSSCTAQSLVFCV